MPARSQAGGLPSGPRARSHARGTRDDEPSDYPRQVRPQKSLVSMRTEDSGRRPPMSRPHDPKQHTSSPSSSSSSYRSDDTSSSSLMNRIRAGTGYSSSRTSIDDDRSEYAPKPQGTHSRYLQILTFIPYTETCCQRRLRELTGETAPLSGTLLPVLRAR